ncbi:hypothetical protein [Xanthomonas citri]|uniref:hypothetical protein n=1 Tax=Xanthomonas citri TaxID=346 RepID=UPI00402AA45F
MDERWKRRLIWQLPVFTKEIGFCESFSHVCRLSPYLNIIGALLCLLLDDAPSGKPYSAFRTQEAIISALIAHNDGLMGLTERTLQAKFAQAKRHVAARKPPSAQGRMCD